MLTQQRPTNSPDLMANACLETLQALRRHLASCRQCRFDPRLCETHRQYASNFETDFREWEQGRTRSA